MYHLGSRHQKLKHWNYCATVRWEEYQYLAHLALLLLFLDPCHQLKKNQRTDHQYYSFEIFLSVFEGIHHFQPINSLYHKFNFWSLFDD